MKNQFRLVLSLALFLFLLMGFAERAEAVEACAHPKYMRQYLNQLKGARSLSVGVGCSAIFAPPGNTAVNIAACAR